MTIKVFNLACSNGHVFEGWFSSQEDFDSQRKRGLVVCPICSDTRIEKRLTASYIKGESHGEKLEQAMQRVMAFARDIAAKADDVGENFAAEARAIRDGRARECMIRGSCSLQEAEALVKEGISILPIPVQIFMARLLFPADFGALALMLVVINIGDVFVQAGLNTALVQKKEIDNKDVSTVFWFSLSISTLIYCIVYLTAPYVESFYVIPDLAKYLRVLALVFFINTFDSILVALVSRVLEYRKLFVASLGPAVFSGLCGIALAWWGAGLWALVAQQLTNQLFHALILCWMVRPKWRHCRSTVVNEALRCTVS